MWFESTIDSPVGGGVGGGESEPDKSEPRWSSLRQSAGAGRGSDKRHSEPMRCGHPRAVHQVVLCANHIVTGAPPAALLGTNEV
jgi:hypothetical protein